MKTAEEMAKEIYEIVLPYETEKSIPGGFPKLFYTKIKENLLEMQRQTREEDAMIAENHLCIGYLCVCDTEIVKAIRSKMEELK